MRVDFGLPEALDGRPLELTIGNFDGLHRGHRTLVDALVRSARQAGRDACLLTFDPHPRCILVPDRCPPQLTTVDEKADLLARAGVDRFVVLEFTREMSRWPAAEFCERVCAALPVSRLVVGHDFALGRDRQGDVAFLRRWFGARDVAVEDLDALVDADGPVSSTRVRGAVMNGDMDVAAELLGYPYFLDSWVEQGHKDSIRIGYPTATLAVTPGKCLPARGIYASWLRVGESWHQAATSVGYRPTFGGDRLTVEGYVLDFAGDVRHQRVRCVFTRRLREERRYDSVDALNTQIAQDIADVRALLAAEGPPEQL